MVLAQMETTKFDFVALGANREEARTALYRAWAEHCSNWPGADPSLDLEEYWGVRYAEIEVGQALRDSERLV